MVKTVSHDEGWTCNCVTDHRPRGDELDLHPVWPLAHGGPEIETNELPLCPNMHRSVHEYLRALIRNKGQLPWATKRNYSPYCRRIAEQGYRRIIAQAMVD